MDRLIGRWHQSLQNEHGFSFICGYCGKNAGPSKYYLLDSSGYSGQTIGIYICPACNRPTYFNSVSGEQSPGPMYGEEIDHLPDSIEDLYNEARNCIKVSAYTSAVLACRKLLMNISVTKGAEPGKKFMFYVDFLESNHFTPPDSRDWVDHIRKKGNEATHELPSIDKADAIELLGFTGMMLRFIYELPGKMNKYKTEQH